jgi:hypothetical protein
MADETLTTEEQASHELLRKERAARHPEFTDRKPNYGRIQNARPTTTPYGRCGTNAGSAKRKSGRNWSGP